MVPSTQLSFHKKLRFSTLKWPFYEFDKESGKNEHVKWKKNKKQIRKKTSAIFLEN